MLLGLMNLFSGILATDYVIGNGITFNDLSNELSFSPSGYASTLKVQVEEMYEFSLPLTIENNVTSIVLNSFDEVETNDYILSNFNFNLTFSKNIESYSFQYEFIQYKNTVSNEWNGENYTINNGDLKSSLYLNWPPAINPDDKIIVNFGIEWDIVKSDALICALSLFTNNGEPIPKMTIHRDERNNQINGVDVSSCIDFHFTLPNGVRNNSVNNEGFYDMNVSSNNLPSNIQKSGKINLLVSFDHSNNFVIDHIISFSSTHNSATSIESFLF